MNSSFLTNSDSKNSLQKRQILQLCINEGNFSLADLSKELNLSIPTTTRLTEELIESGFIEDMGKQDTSGGRRPSIYGLKSSAGYFVGTDIGRTSVSICITDFKGSSIAFYPNLPFRVENSEASFRELCKLIKNHIEKSDVKQDTVLAYGVNLSGRVNNDTGYCFTYFIGEDRPIASLFEEEFNAPVYVENDSRAMTYGEYICGGCHNERDVLLLNVSWGLGMGMVIDGKLSYGKSGFSGEIGHFPMMNNGQICHCGKTGCLETAASGSAAHRVVLEKLKEGHASLLSEKFKSGSDITLEDILDAAHEEDVLAIEAIEEVGTNLGRAIAGLINIFNPELVIIGGCVSSAQDYILLPIKSAVQKHSLSLINRDTKIKISKLGEKAGAIGACMLSRSKLLGLL